MYYMYVILKSSPRTVSLQIFMILVAIVFALNLYTVEQTAAHVTLR